MARKPHTKHSRPPRRPLLRRQGNYKIIGRATVERLFELGVIRTQAQPELLELKAIFDDQIKIAIEEK
jgi:hypothetical protein